MFACFKKVKKSEWDENKHRIKSAERSAANAKLSEYERLAFKFSDNLPIGTAPTQNMFNDFFEEQFGGANANARMTFLTFTERICQQSAKRINSRGEIISLKTQQKYWNTRNLLIDFQKYMRKKTRSKFIIDFNNFGKCTEDLKFFLTKTKGYAPSTINKHLKIVRLFVETAQREGFDCPLNVKELHVKCDRAEHVILTEQELQQIIDLDLRKDPCLNNCKGYFLLSAYTGLRFSDAIRIRRENIQDNMITIHQQKTGQPLQIPVHPKIQSIVEHIDELHPISNAKYNAYIKKVACMAGLCSLVETKKTVGGERIIETKQKWELISSHTARRTFCSLLYAKGLNEWVIMSFSGHKDLNSFKQYICLDSSTKIQMLKSKW